MTGDSESWVSCDSDTNPEKWLDLGSSVFVSTIQQMGQTQVVAHNFRGDSLFLYDGQTRGCFHR